VTDGPHAAGDGPDAAGDRPGVSRRQVLVSGGLAATAPLLLGTPALAGTRALAGQRSAPALARQPDGAGAPPPEQVHVQFGADAASQVAVSWAAAAPVARPRLRAGRAHDGFGLDVPAEERVYTDALTGETVYTYHARIGKLEPDTAFVYEVSHKGAEPVPGTFRTGPRGRSKGFRFTSFGDQSIPAKVGLGLGPATANAGYIVDAVDALDPLFHLMNGDLCYANVSDVPVQTWTSFFTNNMRSARYRPWMPAAGNHENEVGNGPRGYLSYQTRFELPDNGSADFRGNWYAFTVGSIRVVSLNNDDVCLQDGGFSAYRRDHAPGYVANGYDPYIRGYSHGLQMAWLERELAAARHAPGIDWIVVCMHQVAMSSAHFNGADIGIRQEVLPLFDRYGVDLVVAGHEHHFERTFPVRGVLPGSTLLTPAPQGSNPAEIDTRDGSVHMIIGGGGHSSPTPVSDFDMPHDGVLIVGVGPGNPQSQHASMTTTEPAPWSAYRDLATPYGFASFDVVPAEPGGTTSITVTHYGAAAGSSEYSPLDRFVMRKPVRSRNEPTPRELALS
jgi:Calcineurin-like phosphoesterase/Purple acid Phosphatase, N-terminal domain